MYRKLIVLFCLALLSLSFAQEFKDPFRLPEENRLQGGFGVTWIDGEAFTTFTIAPDIAIGNFGVGIYLQLLFDNSSGKLRKIEYQDGPGILRAIRYIRFGQKYDDYYVRVGSLVGATLSHGILVWNYNNSSNYDKRKIGLELDLDFSQIGFETVWGEIGKSGLRGINTYIRPFRFFESSTLLKKFRIHGTFVRDSKVRTEVPDSTTALTAFGLGADFRWLDMPILKSSLYADYAKFDDFGDGKAVGIDLIFPNFIGIFGVGARFEKRFLGEQFVPSLFGPLYELERALGNNTAGVLTKLRNAKKAEGYFGELAGHVINRLYLTGSFQKQNGVPESGILHLEASAPRLVPRFELRGFYDKSGIETFKDARTLDARSLAGLEINYQLNQFLLLSTVYLWYWVEEPQGSGIFKSRERVEPRILLRYNF